MTRKLLFILFISYIACGQAIDSMDVKTPKKAALWSILPGGGQFYNGKYLKGGIMIILESLAIWQSVKNGRDYNNNPTDESLNSRNKFAWWALGIHVYGTLDAVVDSHLKPFNEVMDSKTFEPDNELEETKPDG